MDSRALLLPTEGAVKADSGRAGTDDTGSARDTAGEDPRSRCHLSAVLAGQCGSPAVGGAHAPLLAAAPLATTADLRPHSLYGELHTAPHRTRNETQNACINSCKDRARVSKEGEGKGKDGTMNDSWHSGRWECPRAGSTLEVQGSTAHGCPRGSHSHDGVSLVRTGVVERGPSKPGYLRSFSSWTPACC